MTPVSPKEIVKAFGSFIVENEATTNPLKVLIVGTEAAPYAVEGGFASVLGYLSGYLRNLGHDVRLFIPKFGHIDEEKYNITTLYEGLKVPTDDEEKPYLICNIKQTITPNNVQIYFLENKEYYEQRANVYGYYDDPTRWALLSRGVLEFIRTRLFVPDVIHANDWHTGIVSNYLQTSYAKDPILSKIATVFTIHNIKFQGMFDHNNILELDKDDGHSPVASFFSDRLNMQNYMRRGILYSDIVSTVSKSYAKEVLTSEYGEGLDKLLLEVKSKFFGVINGLDYAEFNPKTDKLITSNYDSYTLSERKPNKIALQKEYDLPINENIPLLGFVGRLDYQKGLDLLVSVLYKLFDNFECQFVQVGGGDPALVSSMQELKKKYPDKVGLHTYFNTSLPRMLFAGTDMIVYPSRFEPCGIVQLEAMRYGSVPVVRNIGGLADTVENFDTVTRSGTGFVFDAFDEFALYGQLIRSFEILKQEKLWQTLQKNCMQKDFSWTFSAGEYVKLYELAQDFKQKKPTQP